MHELRTGNLSNIRYTNVFSEVCNVPEVKRSFFGKFEKDQAISSDLLEEMLRWFIGEYNHKSEIEILKNEMIDNGETTNLSWKEDIVNKRKLSRLFHPDKYLKNGKVVFSLAGKLLSSLTNTSMEGGNLDRTKLLDFINNTLNL